MIYTIANDYLTVMIDSKGAMLRSIVDKDGIEYIWQRDAKYWNLSDINIFPYIARLTDETYMYQDKNYKMGIHGFLWQTDLRCTSKKQDEVTFKLVSTPESKEQYPFDFELELKRQLVGNTLKTTYLVTNNEFNRIMFFGIGGHPAFKVPLEDNFSFSDYRLSFDSQYIPEKVDMSDDCFVLGTFSPFKLGENYELQLQHELFDNDAIILRNTGSFISLFAKDGHHSITIRYPDMHYLGIWHMPRTDANYVCIEPWSSLPSRKNIIEDISTQEDLIRLEPAKHYKNTWEIQVNS